MTEIFITVGVAAVTALCVTLGFLKGNKMDTKELKDNFATFSVAFGTFTTDFAAYLAKQPQDTPEQVADVKAVADGLAAFKTQVEVFDAALNPPPPVV